MKTANVLLCVLAVVFFATAAQAALVTVPPGLSPGDPYRLVFVTSGTWQDPQVSGGLDIAIPNTRVNNAANAVPGLAALGTTWTIIGSVLNTNANANTLTRGSDPSYPIYNLAGERVASGNSTLWGTALENPIRVNELGDTLSVRVWTGTDSNNGQRRGDWFLGDTGGGWRYFGWSGQTVGSFTGNSVPGDATGWASNLGQNWPMTFSYYAMSGTLRAPEQGDIPEPATMALLGLAAAGLGGYIRRRRTA